MPEPAEIRELLTRLPTETKTVFTKGTAGAAAAKRLEATYSRPYLAHASIGPSCAAAVFEGGKLTVWTHAQGSFPLRGQIARVLGMKDDDVTVIHRDGAGCYGHNGADDAALDAALLARACGRPVLLQWTREDELAWAPFGSAMVVKLTAGLDADGKVVDWRHELWSHSHVRRPSAGEGVNLLAAWHVDPPFAASTPRDAPYPPGTGDRNSVPLYDFPAQEVLYHFVAEMPLRVSALRSLGAYANVFAIESFMDELAAAAGADPVAFRLKHLADPRAKAVIEAAAKAANWKPGAASDGVRGRGIAFARYKNSSAYFAVVAEVEVAEKIWLRRAVAAVDAGGVINPDGLKNQVEGGIVQAASWTLKEAVRWDRSRVLTRYVGGLSDPQVRRDARDRGRRARSARLAGPGRRRMRRGADRRCDRERAPPRARRPRPGSAAHAGAGRGGDGVRLASAWRALQPVTRSRRGRVARVSDALMTPGRPGSCSALSVSPDPERPVERDRARAAPGQVEQQRGPGQMGRPRVRVDEELDHRGHAEQRERRERA